MAWEERQRGGQYYYRTRWASEAQRPIKKYVGAGLAGELAAEADRIKRGLVEAEKAEARRELEHLQGLAGPVLELDAAAEILARAHMIAAGYHRHKGEWRRARTHPRGT
jgi:hypothetical protein